MKKSNLLLIAETFARQTLANFANFELYRESFSRKIFENSNSRKFVLQIFFDFPICESLSCQNSSLIDQNS